MLSLDQYEVLLEGAWITVQVTFLAIVVGTALGLIGGVASLSHLRALRWLTRVYVEVFRGVSAIILLFWTFFALPSLLDIQLSALQAGVLALGTNMGAYSTEQFRGAIQAVPKGQTEAAIAVNLSGWQRLRHVVLPQAIVIVLPPYGNLLIEVLKASALVSLIALNDIMFEAQNLRVNRAASSVQIFIAVFAIYWALAGVITGAIRLGERYFGRGLTTGHGAQAVK